MGIATTFHGTFDSQRTTGAGGKKGYHWETERVLEYDVALHQHPYVADLVQRLLERSVRGLQAADTEYGTAKLPDGRPRPVLYDSEFFAKYVPATSVASSPVKELDFAGAGAYSEYNWELFFHVPLTVAIHLSKNGRYEDAQRWFHYIFDPTDDSEGATPQRFWKVRPFQTTHVELIQEILLNLSTRANPSLADETVRNIEAWRRSPFRPHVVARHRPSAYMFKTVMAYLDNLIAWGDSLFRQDTRETINEAMQLYVLAAGILGPRPDEVPRQGTTRPQTYAQLRTDLDEFSNALRSVETDIPFELMPLPVPSGGGQATTTVGNIGRVLYFAVPRNDRLLGYWDTVGDRLFKIRNSLNILGIFRQLPLFEPPIDPALLARAAAAGLDVAAVVSGANQPLPLVRFAQLVQKASELCQEVKALGAGLLSAMEKGDAEALQLLRARHERAVLEAAESVRYSQWQEAIKNREAVEKSWSSAVARYAFYERQLGKQAGEVSVPTRDPLDRKGLDDMKFTATEPEVQLRDLQFDIARLIDGLPGAYPLSSWEVMELAGTVAATLLQPGIAGLQLLAAPINLIPEIEASIEPLGIGAGTKISGATIAGTINYIASALQTTSGMLNSAAGIAAKVGSYARRQQEWEFQSNTAAGEITQLYKQIRAAEIREAIAEQELKNHRQQIEHAKDVEEFLTNERTGKTTNQAFYTWMRREVKGLFTQCFDLAFEVARKAERALQHELGDSTLTFLQPSYTAGNEGLLAGERLHLDIRRMEVAYYDLNRREYELTKHVSLMQLNPKALLELRTTGRCTFALAEELYDLGAAGHYFRRLRNVSVSIAGVTGPYTGVNATLTLLRSSIRRSPLLSNNEYARAGADDDRFSDSFGSLDSIVTSSGQNDAGVFETTLRDERRLPFELQGAVSAWQLELPDDVRLFDYDTIADVVMHVRYTAREGGLPLRAKATDNLKAQFKRASAVGSVRLFSVRHEFPTEWAKLTSTTLTAAKPTAKLELDLREEHYPFWSKGRLDAVKSVDIFARTKKTPLEASVTTTDDDGNETTLKDAFAVDPTLPGVKKCPLTNIPLPKPVGKFAFDINDTSMDELWIAVAWADT